MKYSIYAQDIDGAYKRHGQSSTLADAKIYRTQLKAKGLTKVHIFRLVDGVQVY